MKLAEAGYRVAVVGASSLLGKELTAALEEAKFPVSRLVTVELEEDEPDLPIIDLQAGTAIPVAPEEVSAVELDLAFLASRPRQLPAFLRSRQERGDAAKCLVIDLVGEGPGAETEGDPSETSIDAPAAMAPSLVHIPFLDRRFPIAGVNASPLAIHVSAHPAVIVISSLLLRLAARFPLQTAVAQVYVSASESGARGIEELQRQTISLLSFQKFPHQVFGAQLAFNLLSRLGRSGTGEMPGLEARLRRQLHDYLGARVPRPALRLFLAPIFYSVGVSLYVETAAPVMPEAAAAALAGERIRVRRAAHEPPTPVEVTGSSDILVDSISTDAEHPNGLWLWAVADNLHLAATNALEIAASLREGPRA
jgi:aspartate-semialdehyde dehydrogenase